MKLIKPTVNEEQDALEEYVDFLLTDFSNVTSLESKRSAVTRTSKPSQKNSLCEDKDADLEPQDKQQQSAKNEVPKKISPTEQSNAAEQTRPIDQTEAESKLQSEDKQASTQVYEKVESESEEPESEESESEESESNELAKWQAVLDKENQQKNNAQLETEKQKKTDLVSTAIFDKNSDTEVFNQSEKTEESGIKSSMEPRPKNERTVAEAPLSVSESAEQQRPPKEPDERLLGVEKLLARISIATHPIIVEDSQQQSPKPDIAEPELDSNEMTSIATEATQATFFQRQPHKNKIFLPDVFQTLIFDVGKLPLAVPLLKLGGIVPVSEKVDITPLVGTPKWFMGLVQYDGRSLMVVDTQQYLMPEQEKIADQEYEYLILLDDSNWALACHDVGEAKNLTHDDIRWSQKSSKRPWFGGMVVEYMSALIEVDELINSLASHIVE